MKEAAAWACCICFIVIGVGIVIQLDDLIQTLRLLDVACP